ncbi:hypothetical protein D0C36_06510 [Mucilaginibacter conchicola]|uniref:Uncharacterized protein n=1 Tax=Mucilaginibacter conchicola TaxID=2303333 RepID=A0A372NYJ5_9SPHI|nr:hypothetical protein [Mucilaginibacter conchicola]RFZ95175.1 hypothetical protein D0C36_06510 [Mucilaginibacter conchicola]
MASVEINPGLWLCADTENKKVRLSLNDGHVDLACRLESVSKLNQFIADGEGLLFKGRLQLHKDAGRITVLLNGQPTAQLSVTTLSSLLNSI